jgi:hypothetical protein
VGKCNNTSSHMWLMLQSLGKEWLAMWSCNILCHTFKSGLPPIYSYLLSMRRFSSSHLDILCIHRPQQTESCFIHTSESIRLVCLSSSLHALQTGRPLCNKKKKQERKPQQQSLYNLCKSTIGKKQSSWNFIKHRQSHIYQTRWRYTGRFVPVHALQVHGEAELIHDTYIRWR